jgi:hypothetical protein
MQVRLAKWKETWVAVKMLSETYVGSDAHVEELLSLSQPQLANLQKVILSCRCNIAGLLALAADLAGS